MKVKIERNSLLGRFLVTSEFVKAGTILVSEKPLIVGTPLGNNAIACFQCTRRISQLDFICLECNLAVFCSKTCKILGHSLECKVAKSLNLDKKPIAANYPQIILPLRILLMKWYKKDSWDEFMELEAHMEERKNTPIWQYCDNNVFKVLEKLEILPRGELEDVQKICGILDVNSFELRLPDSHLNSRVEINRGIYLKSALIAHDCIANVHVAQNNQFELIIRAGRDLQKGEIVFFNYSNPMNGTEERRRHLMEGKYFECKCLRCSDSTELQTEISSIICPRCQSTVRSVNPLCNAYKTSWKCSNCSRIFSGQLIKTTIRECQKVLSETSDSIKDLEELLEKLLRTLLPTHYIILELKQKLIGAYTLCKPSEEILEKKIKLCEDLLAIVEIIEPGISRMRGIILYELYTARLWLTQQSHDQDIDELLVKTQNNLNESMKMLMYEPIDSPEHRLYVQASKDAQILALKLNTCENVVTKIQGV